MSTECLELTYQYALKTYLEISDDVDLSEEYANFINAFVAGKVIYCCLKNEDHPINPNFYSNQIKEFQRIYTLLGWDKFFVYTDEFANTNHKSSTDYLTLFVFDFT